MGRRYSQLGLNERIEIYRLRLRGDTLEQIATCIGFHKSTISHELRRNNKPTKVWPGAYDPARADALSERHKRRYCRAMA